MWRAEMRIYVGTKPKHFVAVWSNKRLKYFHFVIVSSEEEKQEKKSNSFLFNCVCFVSGSELSVVCYNKLVQLLQDKAQDTRPSHLIF